jgi:hypothetical protein
VHTLQNNNEFDVLIAIKHKTQENLIMFIKWAHMILTFIIFKGKGKKSIGDQSHLPTKAHNRIKNCTSILKLFVSAAGHHSQVIPNTKEYKHQYINLGSTIPSYTIPV